MFEKKGYRVSDKISEGSFGQVYKAVQTKGERNGQFAAVKVMKIDKIPKLVLQKFLPREFEAATTIRHPNVLEVYDIIRANHCYYIFMEFAPGGTLMDPLRKSDDMRAMAVI